MCNVYRKFGRVSFEICERRDRQANRHTETLITLLRTLAGGRFLSFGQRCHIVLSF